VRKRGRIIFMIIIVIGASTAGFLINKNRAQGLMVKTTKVIKRDLTTTVFTTGRIKPALEDEIVSRTSGIIDQILVKRGDRVEEGQLLAVIDRDNLEYKLEIAKAKYEAAEAEFQMAKRDLEEKKGDALRELEKAELEYEQVISEYEINKELFEKGAISKKDLEVSESNLKMLEIRLNKAQSEVNKLEDTGFYEELIKSKQAALEQCLAELKEVEMEVERRYIKASIEGIVLDVLVEEGTMVQPGTPLFSLGNIDTLEIKGEVNEFDVIKLEPGQRVKITGDGFSNKEYLGVLKEIAPAAITRIIGQSSRTTVEIIVEITSPDSSIRPGFSANMEIITKEKKDIPVLPLECVKNRDGKSYVFLVREDGTVEEREVGTGISNDLYIEIVDGLSEGDIVVANPGENLKSGQKVIVNDKP